ncbi:hypothetical protein GCM10010504_01840 [Streptomyces griseus]|nr:hypothetical protein GCM10010504_01840 [Streptomyces griseus]
MFLAAPFPRMANRRTGATGHRKAQQQAIRRKSEPISICDTEARSPFLPQDGPPDLTDYRAPDGVAESLLAPRRSVPHDRAGGDVVDVAADGPAGRGTAR